MKIFTIITLSIALVFAPLSSAFATGGGLNASGCHNSSTVGYHCHNDYSADEEEVWSSTDKAIIGTAIAAGVIALIVYLATSNRTSSANSRRSARAQRASDVALAPIVPSIRNADSAIEMSADYGLSFGFGF